MGSGGSNYAPDTFIAGEAGAELITGARGRKVFTAAQTGDIFRNLGALSAVMAGGVSMPVVQSYFANASSLATAPTLGATTETQVITLTLQSTPVFNINNGDPEEVRQAFDEYQQDTLNKVDEMWRKTQDDERRGRYD